MERDLENSIQFIKSKVDKTSGFEAPTNHLDSLEDKLFTKLLEEKLPAKTGFSIPESYFENVEDSILSQVKPVKVISLKQRALRIIPFAAAASILLFIGLNAFIFNSNTEVDLNEINDSDIEYWMNNNDISYNDVALVLEDDITLDNDFSMTTIKDESIEDYMNSIDESSFIYEIN